MQLRLHKNEPHPFLSHTKTLQSLIWRLNRLIVLISHVLQSVALAHFGKGFPSYGTPQCGIMHEVLPGLKIS